MKKAPSSVNGKNINGHEPNGSNHEPLNGSTSKTRYSDEELEEFKNIILEKLVKSRNEFKMLTEAGQDEDLSPFEKEENSKYAKREKNHIENLENALIRIENKSYGVCRASGKLISKERLRIVPHATLSCEIKNQREPEKPEPNMHKFH